MYFAKIFGKSVPPSQSLSRRKDSETGDISKEISFHAKDTARPKATKPKAPLATARVAPDVCDEALAEEAVVGPAVATAPTPPVTAPLSFSVVSELPIIKASARKAS